MNLPKEHSDLMERRDSATAQEKLLGRQERS